MSGYTPGDPQPEHDGDVFEQMKRESGDEGQDTVKQSFTVNLSAVLSVIKNWLQKRR